MSFLTQSYCVFRHPFCLITSISVVTQHLIQSLSSLCITFSNHLLNVPIPVILKALCFLRFCQCEPIHPRIHRCIATVRHVHGKCIALSQGRLPVSQKHAVVSPRLKKRGLDTSNMANFRPVSNLTFMSKVVERAVTKQLKEYLIANDLLPCYQSAFQKQHSTEMAMLRVLSDALTAADSQRVTLLGLLDLSAA